METAVQRDSQDNNQQMPFVGFMPTAPCSEAPNSQNDEGLGRRFNGTLLTPRQWEVLRFRSQGLTQTEVAAKLKVTREDICIIEHRAWLKISEAKATLVGLREMATKSRVFVPSGASIYEAAAEILQRADLLGVKLPISSYDILAAIRSKCRGRIRGHHLVSAINVEIGSGGLLRFDLTA